MISIKSSNDIALYTLGMKFPHNTLLQKYPTQVPRYTSYPTAPHFHAMSTQAHETWIKAVPANTAISLYVHIPYCKKLCWFCGCSTKITQKYGPVETYLSLLLREIRMVAERIGRKQAVSHIHFGGGSPTILAPEDFARVMEVLVQQFAIQPNAEIAIEADPRGISEAKVASYKKHGVNRISIGVQDFDASVQEAINRIQPFSMVYDTVKLCRDYGIDNVSLDLIYGLPKQNIESFKRTIDYALLFEPSRIALFGYAHVPWKKKNMRLIDENELPDVTTRYAMFDAASERFNNAGYAAIGLDHFAKQDDSMAIALKARTLKRNFQGYTTDQSNVLIGLGASAISSFSQGYAQNASGVDVYKKAILAAELPTTRGFALSTNDRLRRGIIESLMCYFEVDVASHCNAASVSPSIFDGIFASLMPMKKDGFVSIDGSVIHVNPHFPQAVRLVCAAFDEYFSPDTTQHAQVV